MYTKHTFYEQFKSLLPPIRHPARPVPITRVVFRIHFQRAIHNHAINYRCAKWIEIARFDSWRAIKNCNNAKTRRCFFTDEGKIKRSRRIIAIAPNFQAIIAALSVNSHRPSHRAASTLSEFSFLSSGVSYRAFPRQFERFARFAHLIDACYYANCSGF